MVHWIQVFLYINKVSDNTALSLACLDKIASVICPYSIFSNTKF